jgi:SRSO17 transposase
VADVVAAGALDGLDELDELAEADLGLVEQWAAQLDELGELIGSRFFRPEPRERALGYVKGLLSPVAGETRNGWTLAQAAGERSPDGMQRLLNRAVWDESGVREDLRGYVVEALGAPDGVLVFDETGDIKQGSHTVGVARQYTGVTGQVENCQVSVHAGYVSSRGQALVDVELYLPKAFALDPARCAEAGVPPERAGVVVTKGDLAVEMFHRAVTAGMPFGYVAGDEVYGRSANLRAAVEQAGYGYVLEVGCDFRVSRHPADTVRVDHAGTDVPSWGWEHRCQGPGAKGLRAHAWAWIALDPVGCPDGWARSLLIRRDPDANGNPDANADPDYAYFLCYHRRGTTLGELIGVAGRRWGIEESFAIAKSEAGLDEHQVRRWTAWYRHAILSMLAAAFLAVTRARVPANPTAWQAG